jgi:hypothetical protein
VREELESELGKKGVPSLLFISLGQLRENGVSTPGVDQEPTKRHHVEGQDEPTQGRFGRPVGSAEPLWAQLGLCFRVVVVLWVLRLVPGVHPSLRRVACPWVLQSL